MRNAIYQMTFRGMSFRECWRFARGPFKFAICLVLKFVGKRGEQVILPAHMNEREIEWSEVSGEAKLHLQAHIAIAAQVGYSRNRCVTMIKSLSKVTKEAYAYYCLHDDGKRSLFIAYLSSVTLGVAKHTIVINGLMARTTGLRENYSATVKYFDCPYVIRKPLSRADVKSVDDAMMSRLANDSLSEIRAFKSLSEFTIWMNESNVASFDRKIERGLYVHVADQSG